MTTAIAFLVLGAPIAWTAERLLSLLTSASGGWDEAPGRKRLVWQSDPWRSRLRLGLAALTAPLVAGAIVRFDGREAIGVSVLLVALLVCAATDLLSYRVPNAVTYPGIALALLSDLVMPEGDFASAAAGAGLSAGIFLPVWALTRGGIGMADVKLAVLIGAALGFPGAFHALALGIIVGGLVIGALLASGAVTRQQVTPYAPFLAVSAATIVFVRGAAFAPL